MEILLKTLFDVYGGPGFYEDDTEQQYRGGVLLLIDKAHHDGILTRDEYESLCHSVLHDAAIWDTAKEIAREQGRLPVCLH